MTLVHLRMVRVMAIASYDMCADHNDDEDDCCNCKGRDHDHGHDDNHDHNHYCAYGSELNDHDHRLNMSVYCTIHDHAPGC